MSQNDAHLFDMAGNVKRCTVCEQMLPVTDFHRNSKSRSGLKHYCKNCSREALRDWQSKNIEHQREYRKRYWESNPEYRDRCRAREREKYRQDPKKARDQRLRYRFGISLDAYAAISEAQGNVCAICHDPCATGRDLAVDHDHSCCPQQTKTCGKCIRGLLCQKCNHAIGLFADDRERLLAAIDYLDSAAIRNGQTT